MKSIRLIRAANGLNTSQDPLDVRQGSLLRARNVLAIRDGLIESRRGFSAIVSNLDEFLGDPYGSIFTHDDRIFYYTRGSLFEVEASPPSVTEIAQFDISSARLRTFSLRDVVYLLTDDGPKYFSTGSTPLPVGVPEALDIPIDCPPEDPVGEGPIPVDSQVGYRVVWKRERDGQVLRGAPSIPTFCVNAYVQATWIQDSASQVTIDLDGITEFTGPVIVNQAVWLKDWANATTPGSPPTQTGEVIIASFIGDQIRIVSSDATLNDTGTVWFAIPREASLTILKPEGTQAGDKWEVYRTEASTSETSTPTEEYYLVDEGEWDAGVIPPFMDNQKAGLGLPLYTNPSQGSGGQANHEMPIVTWMDEFRGHSVFASPQWHHELTFRFTALPTVGSTITIGGLVYTAGDENLSDEFKVVQETTLAKSLRTTAQNFVEVINTHHPDLRASYTSGEQGLPGQVTVRRNSVGAQGFGFVATDEGAFDPSDAFGFQSERPGGEDEILIGKWDEAESVNRLVGRIPVGRKGRKVLGIASIKDALIIFKEDGVYGLYGETDRAQGQSFEVREIDTTVRCLAADSIRVVDNIAMALTNQGFVGVNEYAVQVTSHLIDRQVREFIETTDLTLVHSSAYEAEHLYLVWINGTGYAYYVPTGGWTEAYARPFTGTWVDQANRRLYAVTDNGHVLLERKDMVDTDYQDEDGLAIEVEVIWADVAGKDASSLKRFSRVSFEFLNDRASLHQVGFSTDIHPDFNYESEGYETTLRPSDLSSSEPLVAVLPIDKQLARRLRVGYRHSTARERVELSQVAIQLNEMGGIKSSRGVPKRTFS